MPQAPGGEGGEADPRDPGPTPDTASPAPDRDQGPGPAPPQAQPGEDGPADAGQADAGQTPPAGGLRLPPAAAGLDYQLGGAYPPPAGVGIVVRDRLATPAAGHYTICYINGLQTQPGEEGDWDADLILREPNGDPVIDPDWNEALLDITTADKRARIAQVIGRFMGECQRAGFDGIEIDNLDTYARSGGRVSRDDAVAYMRLLADAAHALGLPIGQKNAAELLGRVAEMGTDFSIAEECATWNECADYVSAYGPHVLMIEYVRGDFISSCQTYGTSHPIVLRDVALVAEGRRGYLFEQCP